MFGTTKKAGTDDKYLGFDIDTLEDRKMLAADITVVGGDSLRITGDNTSEAVSVSMNNAGFVTVDGQSTGLTQLKNLSINMRGGNDNVSVNGSGSNALNVTGRTNIRLGSGTNRLDIGGQHNSLRISGGRDADQVFATHQIRNATTNVSLKGGNDAFSFDTGMMADASSNGRVDLSRFNAANNAGRPMKFNLNLGGGNDLVSFSNISGGQETSIPDNEFRPDDAFIIFIGANINGASGTDTLSPVQLTETLTISSGFGTRLRNFEIAADLSNDVIPTPLGADAVFGDPLDAENNSYYDSVIGLQIPGAGTQQLTDAMRVLSQDNPSQSDVNQALSQIAVQRGLSIQNVNAQYQRFLQLKAEAVQIGQANGQPPVDALDATSLTADAAGNVVSAEFMGTNVQLRYGKIVGDVLGLDAVFGSLLNPTGGLVGPGNSALNLGEEPLSYHGAFHDAAGYLFNYHNQGPGYQYVGSSFVFDTDNPLAGQVDGVLLWYGKLDSVLFDATAATNFVVGLFT